MHRGEIDLAVGNSTNGLDEQGTFKLLDPLVHFCLDLPRAHRDSCLPQRRAGIDTLINNVNRDAGFGDAGRESIAHRMCSREQGQKSRMRVDEVRGERSYKPRGQDTHQPCAHNETRPWAGTDAVLLNRGGKLHSPFLARAVITRANNKVRDPCFLRIREPGGLSIRPDTHDFSGILGVPRRVDERFQVTAATGDKNREF